MRSLAVVLAAMISLQPVQRATACQLVDGTVEEPPLQTRKPVHGENVFLITGFGQRRHPILQVPRMHKGVDWAAEPGTPVIAAGSGRVVSAGRQGEYGNMVLIEHGAGWETVYAHLASFGVQAGDCVDAGSVIGAIGSTGLTAGPAVHFEVRRNGNPIDPMQVPYRNPGER